MDVYEYVSIRTQGHVLCIEIGLTSDFSSGLLYIERKVHVDVASIRTQGHVLCIEIGLTSDLSSGLLCTYIIITLFCWHVQQRLDMGLHTRI